MLLRVKTLIVSLILCGIAAFMCIHDESERLLAVPMLEEEEWEELKGQRQEGDLDFDLYFDGARLPEYHSALGDGYLMAQNTEAWTGSLSVSENCNLALIPSELWENPKKAAGGMEALPFVVYDQNTFQMGNLYVTTLPVMTLRKEYTDSSDGTERMYGKMTLFNTADLPGTCVRETDCEFHVRGSASRVYYKVGYKLNLLDEDGNKKNESLLNMREDDDWILRAMGLDESKVRRVCY